MSFDCCENGFRHRDAHRGWEPDQNYSRRLRPGHEDVPSEVFVLGQKDAVINVGLIDDGSVNGSLPLVNDSHNVMAGRPERADNKGIAALIGEKATCRHFN